jgi:hypothetical protein
MKNIFIILVLFISFVNTSYSQMPSVEDTKGYVMRAVNGNPPLENYHTAMFFNNDILKTDAETYAGKKLTDDEFENIIMFGSDVYRQGRTGWLWTHISTADIRDMHKIEIKKSGDGNGQHCCYIISVYFHGYYHKNFYEKSNSNPTPKNKYLDKMEIFIGNNYEEVVSIKKVLILLAHLKGKDVMDGDR